MCMHLRVHGHIFLLGIYQGVRLLCYRLSHLFNFFLDNAERLPAAVYLNTHNPHFCQLGTDSLLLLILTILEGKWWHLWFQFAVPWCTSKWKSSPWWIKSELLGRLFFVGFLVWGPLSRLFLPPGVSKNEKSIIFHKFIMHWISSFMKYPFMSHAFFWAHFSIEVFYINLLSAYVDAHTLSVLSF